MSAAAHEEKQYLNLIREIVQRGEYEIGRNGGTFSIFGYSMRFSLLGGQIPLITTKKLAWKTCFKELMWFIRGQTDAKILQRDGVHIWDGNSTREFLDSAGLTARAEGDLGPVYGHQWRHFNAPYMDCQTDYTGRGIDQLARIIENLKNPATRSSRRHIMSAWNPAQLDEMALPPCHCFVQFHVSGGGTRLSCALYQRSGDVGLGVPFNIASYSFLTHLVAHCCGLEAGEFVYFLGNAHIYNQHIEALMIQSGKTPLPFPRLQIRGGAKSIEEYSLEDIEWLQPYMCLDKLDMPFVP